MKEQPLQNKTSNKQKSKRPVVVETVIAKPGDFVLSTENQHMFVNPQAEVLETVLNSLDTGHGNGFAVLELLRREQNHTVFTSRYENQTLMARTDSNITKRGKSSPQTNRWISSKTMNSRFLATPMNCSSFKMSSKSSWVFETENLAQAGSVGEPCKSTPAPRHPNSSWTASKNPSITSRLISTHT
jgi:hypothetical protein